MTNTFEHQYIYDDHIAPAVRTVLGAIPKRWGRMDPLSRLAVVETGRALLAAGLLDDNYNLALDGPAGLIGLTSYGSLATDQQFVSSMAGGVELASPMLFGYTLPNIALAEAASHYGLRGPVYSLFAGGNFAEVVRECRRWLADKKGLSFMVAAQLDMPTAADASTKQTDGIKARFAIIK